MGSVAFLAGIVIFMISTIGFHAGIRDPMDNPAVFAVYAQSDPWIAAHIGQFAGKNMRSFSFLTFLNPVI
jgi:hypothetical protein